MEMESRRCGEFRLAWLFIASLAAFAQSAPQPRVVIVDSSGALVNTAWRTAPEPAAKLPVREIDRNESAAIESCLNYVDAQWTYLRAAPRADGRPAFAEKIRSASGTHDGLYWPMEADGEESPMGPGFAGAAAAELDPADARPLSGYYFKILAPQRPDAARGTRKNRVPGRLMEGFALVAWPARYGITGVRVFQVNDRGEVYAKDLGAATAR